MFLKLCWPPNTPLHRGCDLCASPVWPQNRPGRHWRHKGGRKVALPLKCCTEDVQTSPWTPWSPRSFEHVQNSREKRSPRRLVAHRSFKGGRRKARASPWSQNGCTGVGHWSLRKNAYFCKHCVSIWAMLLPPLHHHCACFGRPVASIERLWRP